MSLKQLTGNCTWDNSYRYFTPIYTAVPIKHSILKRNTSQTKIRETASSASWPDPTNSTSYVSEWGLKKKKKTFVLTCKSYLIVFLQLGPLLLICRSEKITVHIEWYRIKVYRLNKLKSLQLQRENLLSIRKMPERKEKKVFCISNTTRNLLFFPSLWELSYDELLCSGIFA